MTPDNLTQILDEIAVLSQPPQLRGDEFTVSMFAEHAKLPRRIADTRLEKLLQGGGLLRRKVLYAGHRCWAYRPADKIVSTAAQAETS